MSFQVVRRSSKTPKHRKWIIDATLEDGSRKRLTIRGIDHTATKGEAKRLAKEQWEAFLSRRRSDRFAPLTLGQLLERDRNRADASPQTKLIAENRAARLLSYFDPDMPANDLTGAEVERYKAWRKGQKVSNRTINMEVSHVLAPALNRAREDGLLDPEGAFKIRRLPEERKPIRWLESWEARKIVQIVRQSPLDSFKRPTMVGDSIEFLLRTGLRSSEFMGLRDGTRPGFKWDDIDWARREVRITNRKRGSRSVVTTRKIPLSDECLAILKRREKDQPDQPGPWNYLFRLKIWVKRAGELAGLDRANQITPHCLRHTFATLALQSGANIRDVAALLGDSVETTARVYLHESEEGMRRAVGSLF